MRRRLVLLSAVACCVVASAQILPKDPNDDGVPSVTDPSVPLSYVGNDGSVSIGVNREGQTEGQLLGVFARNNARALVGQVWWDRAGAGGAQADYNWLWGGDPIAAREHPDQATVSRLSFALDQNAEHVDGEQSRDEIVRAGFDPAVVDRVLRLVRISEWKRQQAAPGPKVSRRAFGRERRYPITSGWR